MAELVQADGTHSAVCPPQASAFSLVLCCPHICRLPTPILCTFTESQETLPLPLPPCLCVPTVPKLCLCCSQGVVGQGPWDLAGQASSAHDGLWFVLSLPVINSLEIRPLADSSRLPLFASYFHISIFRLITKFSKVLLTIHFLLQNSLKSSRKVAKMVQRVPISSHTAASAGDASRPCPHASFERPPQGGTTDLTTVAEAPGARSRTA